MRLIFQLMQCPSPKCREPLIQIRRMTSERPVKPGPLIEVREDEWFAVPRFSARPVDPLIPAPIADDYREAASILDISHRMSAVLSRRILAEVLERYCGLTDQSLAARIDKFVSNDRFPSGLRNNMHYLREMGNFGAHTQTNDAGDVIDVTRDEAEWTLDVIDGLLDHLVINPARDATRRRSFDEKVREANRKPLSDAGPR